MNMTLTLTQEQAKCLLDALCVYDRETTTNVARCSAPNALPTEKKLVGYYQHEKALAAELRAPLYKMAFAEPGG